MPVPPLMVAAAIVSVAIKASQAVCPNFYATGGWMGGAREGRVSGRPPVGTSPAPIAKVVLEAFDLGSSAWIGGLVLWQAAVL